jgi:glycosyltransferase involved in cell wall biosynthesis
MRQLFRERYEEIDGNRLKVITNGYDEIDFEGIERSKRRAKKRVHLIHAGLLDPHDRNPEPFFKGISLLLQRGRVRRDDLVVELIAPGNEENYQQAIDKIGLGGVIKLQGSVPYKEALQKMAAADILLLFQGESCAHQIPAKAYEYLRIGRPIFALTPAASDTGTLILEASAGTVVPPEQPEAIAMALEKWIANVQRGIELPAASFDTAAKHSRKEQTKLLAQCFDAILDESGRR